jgi:hypothetical protein
MEENEKKVTVRSLNKNKDGVLIQSMDGKYQDRIPWEEFKKCFTAVEGKKNIYLMTLPPEIEGAVEYQQKRLKFITQDFARILICLNKPNDVSSMFVLGGIVRKYLSEFPGASQADFVNDFNALKAYLQGGYER